MRRTYSYNAFTTQLSSPISDSATSMSVASASGLTKPCYLVIEPDSLTKREYVKVVEITGTTLECSTADNRGLAGSIAGAQQHDSGVEVRAVMAHQIIDDIFLDLADLEDWQDDHGRGTDENDHPEATTTTRGFMSSTDKSKLDGIVEGSGNGFDADTVDGSHAADFATSGHNHSGVYAPSSHEDDHLSADGWMRSGHDVSNTGKSHSGAWEDTNATDTFVKPSEWNTYKIVAFGTVTFLGLDSLAQAQARMVIGSDNGAAAESPIIGVGSVSVGCAHEKAALSASSVTIKMQGYETAGIVQSGTKSLMWIAYRES